MFSVSPLKKAFFIGTLSMLAVPMILYACGIPDMEIVKEIDGNPAFVHKGDLIYYTVRIRSLVPSAAGSHVSVIDDLPAGLENVTPPGSTPCQIQTNRISCFFNEPITSSTPQTLRFVFRVGQNATCGPLTNTVRIDSMNEPDSNPSNNQSSVTVLVRCDAPEIRLTKKILVGSPAVKAGDRVKYELRVRNLDTDVTVRNVKIFDSIPEGLQYDAANSSPYCSQQGQTIQCAFPEIQRNSDGVFPIQFTVLPSVVYPSPICTNGIDNSAYATADGTNRSDSEIVHLNVLCPIPNVIISKTVNKTTVKPGETVSYEVVLKNTGDADALGAEFFDDLPTVSGVTFVPGQSDSRCQSTNTATILYCQIGTMRPGQEIKITLVFSIAANATCNASFINRVRLNTLTQTSVPAESPQTTILCDTPQLSAVKSADRTTIVPGDRIVYTIRIDNSGNGTARDVVIEDRIPAGLQFDSAQSDGSCSIVSDFVRCGSFTISGNSNKSVEIAFTFTRS